ncbi:hypothetical protein DOK78_000853 [Enterococcus sp. DIV2402]|uniref:Uncharacterized protein n=1 Tax=Candidatus Enterococcus lowellii TaxID=2230877 RepID=A0ABZ2SL56_9ENTE|nr:hypothetical protein [Enterococcus sp. DIV2402]MBO0465814.1 hypothetical protein [Enterococcus sp. DIV2402]
MKRVTKYGIILVLGISLLGIWLSFNSNMEEGKSTLFSICLLLISLSLYLIVGGENNESDKV